MSGVGDRGVVPELREVHGPGALNGGWRRSRDLLLLMSVSDYRKAYFGTALGYFWSLLRPLLMFGILLVVFTRIFRVGSGVPNYPVMLLFNIVLFGFFQEATGTATTSVVANEGIVRKTQFPRLVIPLSTVATGFLNLTTNLVAVAIFVMFFGVDPQWTWLLLPLVLLVLLGLTIVVAMLLSALYVRRRDVQIIWSVLSTALFYGSAVLYPIEVVPEGALREVIFVNPLALLLVQSRHWFFDPSAPSAVSAAGGWVHLLPAALATIVVAVGGVWFFTREMPHAAEEL